MGYLLSGTILALLGATSAYYATSLWTGSLVILGLTPSGAIDNLHFAQWIEFSLAVILSAIFFLGAGVLFLHWFDDRNTTARPRLVQP